MESALPTATPYEGWELPDSVVDVRTLTTTDPSVLTTPISCDPPPLYPWFPPPFIPERMGRETLEPQSCSCSHEHTNEEEEEDRRNLVGK